MALVSPCLVATSKFQRLLDQIMNGNPYVYVNWTPDLGIRSITKCSIQNENRVGIILGNKNYLLYLFCMRNSSVLESAPF